MLTRLRRWLVDRVRGGYVPQGMHRLPITYAELLRARTSRHMLGELETPAGMVLIDNRPARGRVVAQSVGRARPPPAPAGPPARLSSASTTRSESAATKSAVTESAGTVDGMVRADGDLPFSDLMEEEGGDATGTGSDFDGDGGGGGDPAGDVVVESAREVRRRRERDRLIDPLSPRGRQMAREGRWQAQARVERVR